jgi:hypothetical protein
MAMQVGGETKARRWAFGKEPYLYLTYTANGKKNQVGRKNARYMVDKAGDY